MRCYRRHCVFLFTRRAALRAHIPPATSTCARFTCAPPAAATCRRLLPFLFCGFVPAVFFTPFIHRLPFRTFSSFCTAAVMRFNTKRLLPPATVSFYRFIKRNTRGTHTYARTLRFAVFYLQSLSRMGLLQVRPFPYLVYCAPPYTAATTAVFCCVHAPAQAFLPPVLVLLR